MRKTSKVMTDPSNGSTGSPTGSGSGGLRTYELEYPNKYFALERQKDPSAALGAGPAAIIPNTTYAVNNVYLDGVRIASLVNTGHARYFLTDQVDSVGVVTNDAGQAITRTEYLPYGETWFMEGDKNYAPKFNSQELDKESNFYFMNARHYDPELTRFVTADTVVDGDNAYASWNRYMYVHGNPVMYKDPTGHKIQGSFLDAIKGLFNGGSEPRDSYAQDSKAASTQSAGSDEGAKENVKNAVQVSIQTDPATGKKYEVHQLRYNPLKQGNLDSAAGKKWGCMAVCEIIQGDSFAGTNSNLNDSYNAAVAAGYVKDDTTVKNPEGVIKLQSGQRVTRESTDVASAGMPAINSKIQSEIDSGRLVQARVPHHSEIIYGYRKDMETGRVDYLIHDVGYQKNHRMDDQGQFYKMNGKGQEIEHAGRTLESVFTYKQRN